jgi:DNA repair exonuclease SbcCD ATPase subunit
VIIIKSINYLSISALKVHPRNQEFFDDIEGDDYEQFKKSIQEEGIITPLLVAPDMTIVSGHQRYKAAKELNINTIPVIINEDLKDEDEKLKKLLAANFGRMKNSPAKQRKVAVEYVGLCGNKHGGSRGDNRHLKLSQESIAKELGISERTLRELLAIEHKLTPEIKELLDSGIITKTSASKIWTKLSEEEQLELLNEVGKDRIAELTQLQLQEYIKENYDLQKIIKNTEQLEQKIIEIEKEKNNIINTKQTELNNLISEKDQLKKDLELERNNIKVPDDYKDLKTKIKDNGTNYHNLRNEYEQKVNKIKELEDELNILNNKSVKNDYINKLKDNALTFCARIDDFIDKTSGFIFLSDNVNKLPEFEKRSYLKAIDMMENWVNTAKANLKIYINEN